MSMKMGFEGRLYRNAGDYESPDWLEVDNVGDLALGLEKGESDVTIRRGRGWRWTRGALKEATIEFQMVWDPEDAGLMAMKAAHDQRAPIEFAVMDGPIDDVASEGLRATMEVLKFSRGEGKEDAMLVEVAVKPTYAAHEPEWIAAEQTSIQATGQSGHVEARSTNSWSEARGGANPDANVASLYIETDLEFQTAPQWVLRRGYLQFPTESLSAETILSATLRLRFYYVPFESPGLVQVFRLAADYGNLGVEDWGAAAGAAIAEIDANGYQQNGWIEIPVAPALIATDAKTAFLVREATHDVPDSDPYAEESRSAGATFYSPRSAGNEPQLILVTKHI